LLFLLVFLPPPTFTLFPYTTLFRSRVCEGAGLNAEHVLAGYARNRGDPTLVPAGHRTARVGVGVEGARTQVVHHHEITVGHDLRSEEHTSELQSRFDLVCRLLLEKK